MAATYTFEDLSGGPPASTKSDNPYSDLIEACDNDASKIQARYLTHRTTRNAQQREILLSPDFTGVKVDEILRKLEHPEKFPGFQDPRHCLVVWARPTKGVRELIGECQRRLREVVPHLWLMPEECLHMTALEVVHSRTADEVSTLVAQIQPHLQSIFALPANLRVELIKPLLSFDAQAVALSFVPVARSSPSSNDHTADSRNDSTTYHHLRGALYNLLSSPPCSLPIASRYVTPSAHLTIARFIEASDFVKPETGAVDHGKVEKLVNVLDGLNQWLEGEVWKLAESESGKRKGAKWVVGEERGLDVRRGTLWYGGGEQVGMGAGF